MSIHYHLPSDGFNFGKPGTHALDFESHGNFIRKNVKSSFIDQIRNSCLLEN